MLLVTVSVFGQAKIEYFEYDLKNGMHVIVIGAGPSGVAAGVKMREAGISFTIYERGTNCGGTWYHNTYPEAGCDVPSHFYFGTFYLRPQDPIILVFLSNRG